VTAVTERPIGPNLTSTLIETSDPVDRYIQENRIIRRDLAMLDAYIIDAIRREELERERQYEEGRRIWLELPLPSPSGHHDHAPELEDEPERGVIVIPLYPDDEAEDAA